MCIRDRFLPHVQRNANRLVDGYWREIKSQDRRVEKLTPPASLFQHIGDISSLKENGLSGRKQREPFFDQFDQKFKGMNPSATVTTSMSSHSGEPQDAYEKGSGFSGLQLPERGIICR